MFGHMLWKNENKKRMTQKEHNMKGPLRVSYIHTFEYNKSEKRREREREREREFWDTSSSEN